MEFDYDIVIVGAGAAGIGMAHVLKGLGIKRLTMLERHEVGASFLRWPKEMRFISPSFTGNAFGMLDLNAVTLETSPAYTLETEHPSGRQFAEYLRLIVKEYKLPVKTGIEVLSVSPTVSPGGQATATPGHVKSMATGTGKGSGSTKRPPGSKSLRKSNSHIEDEIASETHGFIIDTSVGLMTSRFVIWAAGEFQYPNTNGFSGAELCIHNSTIDSWRAAARGVCIPRDESPKDVAAEEQVANHFIVIGGNESGIDAAINLSRRGKIVTVLDRGSPWESTGSDPSKTLTPYTLERLERSLNSDRIELVSRTRVKSVTCADGLFTVKTRSKSWVTRNPPILATGFSGSLKLVERLFDWRDDGHVELTDEDESSQTPGLFVSGPMVRHGGAVFCFIYKFRQRFAVVANAIAKRLGVDPEPLEKYRRKQMFLDDLSCCDDECEC